MNNEESGSSSETTQNKYNILKYIFGRKRKSKVSLSETIAEAVSQNNQSDYPIREEEQKILINAVNFTDAIVEDIMIPRTDIIAIPLNVKFSELKKTILDTGHTRIPVYEESLDNIKGYIHIKDLLSYFDSQKKFDVQDILRTSLFIPPSMKVVDVVHKMRSSSIRIAIVIDEYGGTDGMITIENLIDEIVGEIENDEIIAIQENNYEVNARIKIEDLEERLNLKLVDHNKLDDDFDTLGGLIVSICKKIPEAGEIIKHKSGIKFYIKEAEARFIKTVVIQL